jgi:hypothetical protein
MGAGADMTYSKYILSSQTIKLLSEIFLIKRQPYLPCQRLMCLLSDQRRKKEKKKGYQNHDFIQYLVFLRYLTDWHSKSTQNYEGFNFTDSSDCASLSWPSMQNLVCL